MMLRIVSFCAAAVLCVAVRTAASEPLEGRLPEPRDEACLKLPYPPTSLENDEQGLVVVGVRVGADGTPLETKIMMSSGFPALDKAVLRGFIQCKQRPGTEGGKPVAMWMFVHYYWTIDQAEDQLRRRLAQEAIGGNAASRYKLGAFLKSRAKSEDEWRRGMELIISAAELGDSMAQVILAMEYESGANVETDMNKAVDWYTKAAEQGNVFAVDHLRSLNPVRVTRP